MLVNNVLNYVFGFIPLLNCPLTKNADIYKECSNYETRKFDFIIVGSGTAGCTLANRLTENKDWNVLVLEDGGYPTRMSEVPANFMFQQETEADWSFLAKQEGYFKGMVNQTNKCPQGRSLGGSSAINVMLFAPGFPQDYDEWGDAVDDSWKWANVNKYFVKMKQYVRNTNYSSDRHGRTLMRRSAANLGINVDAKGEEYGYRDIPLSIHNHARFSMAKAYIKPVRNRPNLCVVLKTRVNKINIITDSEGKPQATGVEVQTPKGPVTINATKEVIVTAGAINSPKLLMLSGIGPKEHLQGHGIKVYEDLPVGKFFQDHMYVPVFAKVPDLFMVPYQMLLSLYCTLRGFMLDNVNLANFFGYFNTKNVTKQPDIEYLHFQFLTKDPVYLEGFIEKFNIAEPFAKQLREWNSNRNILVFANILLHPKSRGYLELQDTDPKTPPILHPNYFAEEEDKRVIIDSFNNILGPILQTPPMYPDSQMLRFDLPECDVHEYQSDKYWECYLTYFTGTIYHQAGTCRMGKTLTDSVVDARLRVWNVKNLRVADSSTIPELISGHSNIPTCMLAEHAADIIKEDYNFS